MSNPSYPCYVQLMCQLISKLLVSGCFNLFDNIGIC